ncbi:MAG: TetR/AcrR family transcriptional regulator [Myxococcota bacterium]|nr:TetR/AcrR family transcriptional regulator [Myxococcota bacterium]MEC9390489.1 TetR/AcrR family transcriptional regulator [Myxococcota bacterium]
MTDSEASRPNNKRVMITDAAIAVFAEKGYRSARVADVAKRAGVADGTIYLYFKNKEDLLLSIFEEKMGLLLERLHTDLNGVECPLERMRIYVKHHFEQLRTQPLLAQVFQVELRQSHKFLREYRPEPLWAYLNVIGDAVKDGQSQGIIRDDVDPFIAKWAFFGALDELSMQWVLTRNRDRFDLEVAAGQVVDTFFRGVLSAQS